MTTHDSPKHQKRRSTRSDTSCGCDTQLNRRRFHQLAGLGAATLATGAPLFSDALAGPFSNDDFDKLVPADKKLSADWIGALYQRGQPDIWRGDDLAFIGMPVGGICCGQLYLGGDGRLWHWDIFKSDYRSDYGGMSSGKHYAKPLQPTSPIEQGFAIRVSHGGQSQVRQLSHEGFPDITFKGQYPLGLVNYRDSACPIEVDLQAFSPFTPLNALDSALPVTVMSYRVRNKISRATIQIELAGWLQNAVCRDDDRPSVGIRRNRLVQRDGLTCLACTAEPAPEDDSVKMRPEIVFANFEREKYERWTAEGSAFGQGPLAHDEMSDYHDVAGHHGQRLVNSHNTRGGEDVRTGDAHTGKLTSDTFTIARRYISFDIGGGKHPQKTCMNLIVDDKVLRTATGHNANRMRSEFFDVAKLEGQQARLEIIDDVAGPWGNIGIDTIVFCDQPPHRAPLHELPGYGSMALSLLTGQEDASACLSLPVGTDASVFELLRPGSADTITKPFGEILVGALGQQATLAAGQSVTITFLVSWWFPYYTKVDGEWAPIRDIQMLNRHYENRFRSAVSVASYVASNFERLAGDTRLWNRTWYDSTLPHWLLDRTFITLDCLATQTCHWFDNDRFYGWEGVTCCPGTCQHVWNYAQGLARIFPELERCVREQVDFGIAFRENGALDYRAESGRQVATDGQCGTILRAYREHLTAADDSYLKRNWRRIKRAIEYIIELDGNDNGLLEGAQYNTLDQAWYGPMAWISSLYLGALAAGEAMARDLGDDAFARRCRKIIDAGSANLVGQLYNGEYFIHEPDPKYPDATNTNDGCHIDQVFGQSYCWQLGLPRVVPKQETESALRALWRYNFSPDAGGYHKTMREGVKIIKAGRWYAMPGEAGLIMTTWPRGGAEKATGTGTHDWAVGYFNECMTGFEYQVASHMIYEGEPGSDLVEKGLAITRAIHDRYHPSRRNPYNEIECSDHYARAMASFGVFLALCGFEYNGPKGHIGFAPRLSPENFRAAFLAAEGWGTYHQARRRDVQTSDLTVRWGFLRLTSFAAQIPAKRRAQSAKVTVGGRQLDVELAQEGQRIALSFPETTLEFQQHLEVAIELV